MCLSLRPKIRNLVTYIINQPFKIKMKKIFANILGAFALINGIIGIGLIIARSRAGFIFGVLALCSWYLASKLTN